MENVTILLAPRTALIGRRQAVDDVCRLLLRDDVPLVTLTGSGGVGKTRLALQAAIDLTPGYADGVRLVELAPLRQPDLVLPAIAQACGLDDRGDRPPLDLLIGHLRHRRTLLVLDNFEHLLDAVPPLADLLGACPGLTILATSRSILHLSGEHEFLVHPLPRSEAVQLFVARARAADAGFALTAATAPVVSAICDRLDGLPLALELAAARVRSLPLAALLARLDASLTMLTGGARDQPDRHQTMRDAIAWSYDLLDGQEQLLLRRLAVFVGGFGLEGANAVAHGVVIRPDALDGVGSLAEKSLVRQVSGPLADEPRYQMLETVREFGLERLTAADELEATQTTHRHFVVSMVERLSASLFATGHDRAVARLETEIDNIRAAFATMGDDPELGLRLAGQLMYFWMVRGSYKEGFPHYVRELARADRRPRPALARALTGAGRFARFLGDLDAARPLLMEAIDVARAVDDIEDEALALQTLGVLQLEGGDIAAGDRLIRRSLALFRGLETALPAGAWLVYLGCIVQGQAALALGDDAAAERLLEEALMRHQALDFGWGKSHALQAMGDLAFGRGDHRRALVWYRESVDHARDDSERRFLVEALAGIAGVAAVHGQ